MKIFKVTAELFLTTQIICVAPPYFQFYYELFTEIINNQIHAFPVTCLRLHITIPCTIDDWLQKQHKITSSHVF